MEKFRELGLSEELVEVLKHSGFTEPSEIQRKIIPLVLAGKDVVGGSATGSGKTLAFVSPIIENLKSNKKIQALILTPTRELAEQVANAINNFGKRKLNVLPIYGGVNINYQIRKIPITDVVVGTPGRILDHLKRRTLSLDFIKFLVLDEVDQMFDMGFRNDVEKIISKCPKNRQTMMFSATLSKEIDHLAKKYTVNPIEVSVKSHVDPLKLEQVFYDVNSSRKFSLLVNLLKHEGSELIMIFCSTRRNVDFIYNNLKNLGINARAIHGGIEQKRRINILEDFHKKRFNVLVCTDVAARGLDIKGVSHVYNYDVPADLKDYIHRIGRTARAGKDGKAITLLSERDYDKFRSLTRSDEVNITPQELPQLEFVKIQSNYGDREFRARPFRNRSPRNFRRNFR